jgi:hypothetical protein
LTRNGNFLYLEMDSPRKQWLSCAVSGFGYHNGYQR